MSSDEEPEVSTKKLLETTDSKALASQLSTGKDGERDQSEFENESDETREEIDLEDIERGGGDSDFEDEDEGNNVTVHENENGGEGETNDKDQDSKATKQKDTLPEPTQEVKSVLIKNKEECDKCRNRIGKGVKMYNVFQNQALEMCWNYKRNYKTRSNDCKYLALPQVSRN